MDLAENRFGKTWKHFLEVLKVDYNCSLADVCRDQHTTFGGMSSWMSRRGYSVKQAKADVVRDYYGGVEPSQPTTFSPSFTQIAPAMLSEEQLRFPLRAPPNPWEPSSSMRRLYLLAILRMAG